MSSGNITTEYARAELAWDDAVTEAAALVRNAVLRRALAVAACEYVRLAQERPGHGGAVALPDDGIGLMVAWVMRASDELQRGSETVGQQGSEVGR